MTQHSVLRPHRADKTDSGRMIGKQIGRHRVRAIQVRGTLMRHMTLKVARRGLQVYLGSDTVSCCGISQPKVRTVEGLN